VALAGCGGGGGGGGGDGGDGGDGGSDGGSTDGGDSGGGGGGQLTLGVSNFTSSNPLEVLLTRSAEWWAEDKGYSVTTAAADGTTSGQLSDARNLLQQGVDGLLLTASDSSGMATIVDEADVPVFSCDIPTYHEDIPLHTAIDQFDFGRTTGQELVKTMREQHPDVSQYKVLEILMDQDNSNAVMRHRSFNNAIDEHDDVEVVKQIEIDGYAATDVQQKASSWFQTDPEFQGIGAPWFGGPIGCMRAMEQQDMLHPAGEDGHISIVNMDAIPTIIDAIKDGFIDKTVGQAIRWYSVISMKYMIDYIEAGEDEGVLPSIGDTIERGDLNLAEGTNEHLGNPIFDPPEPRWPPAEVVEFETFGGEKLGFPFIKVNIPVVTQENADDWWLDANLTRHL
jgi:ABC-type sugar transport system substrate-binding protein